MKFRIVVMFALVAQSMSATSTTWIPHYIPCRIEPNSSIATLSTGNGIFLMDYGIG